MDTSPFVRRAQQDPRLAPFLGEVAADAQAHLAETAPPRYTVSGLDLLLGIAAYALYRWLKEAFDQRRAAHEAALLDQQARVIADLIAAGVPPAEAQAVTLALLDRLQRRGSDDTAVQAALDLLKLDA